MYFLLPHWVPATWRSRAQTSIRAEFPSGNVPTARVLRRIHFLQLSDYNSGFFPGGLFVFLRMDGLEHLGNQLYLGMRNNRKHISVKVRSCTNK